MNALGILRALLSSSPAFDAFPFSTSGASSFALAASNQNNALAFASGGGFNIAGAAALCASLPTHSWEYGAATLALLELYTPWASVYGMKAGAWNIEVDVTNVRIPQLNVSTRALTSACSSPFPIDSCHGLGALVDRS